MTPADIEMLVMKDPSLRTSSTFSMKAIVPLAGKDHLPNTSINENSISQLNKDYSNAVLPTQFPPPDLVVKGPHETLGA